MDVTEMLSIDFSRYEKVMLDKVIITGTKINAKKDRWDGVTITGFINDECVISSFYDKEDEIRIREIDNEFLVIARREERKG